MFKYDCYALLYLKTFPNVQNCTVSFNVTNIFKLETKAHKICSYYCHNKPVNAAGLDSVLYWFCVDIILCRGLSVGDETSESSSIIILLLGWFLGSSLSLCSNEYFKRSSFWLDSLNLAWALFS